MALFGRRLHVTLIRMFAWLDSLMDLPHSMTLSMQSHWSSLQMILIDANHYESTEAFLANGGPRVLMNLSIERLLHLHLKNEFSPQHSSKTVSQSSSMWVSSSNTLDLLAVFILKVTPEQGFHPHELFFPDWGLPEEPFVLCISSFRVLVVSL